MKVITYLKLFITASLTVSLLSCGSVSQESKNGKNTESNQKSGTAIGISERISSAKSAGDLPEVVTEQVSGTLFEKLIAGNNIWQFANFAVMQRFILSGDDSGEALYLAPIYSDEFGQANMTPEEIAEMKGNKRELNWKVPMRFWEKFDPTDSRFGKLKFAFTDAANPNNFYCIMYNGQIYDSYPAEYGLTSQFCDAEKANFVSVQEARIIRIGYYVNQFLEQLGDDAQAIEEINLLGFGLREEGSVEETLFFEEFKKVLTERVYSPERIDEIISVVRSILFSAN